MANKERNFESESGIWNDRNMPVCSFCEGNYDDVDGELFDTPFSGVLCCRSENCMEELAEHCLKEGLVSYGKVEEVFDE